ncbi:hypothetical protein Vadar_014201 [Vaccinium darrowii]|uniref:Uncharacterized protein n=1 Tax=Vaccinium darrowii TaxID=229202 RepID=A0ACB7Y0K0_9ERIC|nr:hypothetical protein Vadar_014201 [Vaccinium darrowii]
MDIDDGSYSICNKSNLKLGENFSLEGRTKNSNFSLGTQCLLDGKRCLDNVLISKIENSSEIIEGKTNLEDFLSSVEGHKQSCDFSPHYFLPQAFKTTLPVIDRVGLIAAMKTQTIQTKEMIQQLSKKQSQDMTMGVSLFKQKLGHHVVPQSLLLADTKAGTLEPVPLAILDRRLVKFKGKPTTQLLIPWTNFFPEEATWEFYHSFKAKFLLYMHKKGLLFPNASRFPCVVDGAYLYAYTAFNELITLLVFVEMMLVCHLVVAGVARSRVSLPFGIMGSRLICVALYCGVCLVMTVIINIGAAAELTTTILFTRFFFNLEDKSESSPSLARGIRSCYVFEQNHTVALLLHAVSTVVEDEDDMVDELLNICLRTFLKKLNFTLFTAITREAKDFGLGKTMYYVVLVCCGIVWQGCFLGRIGVTFAGSSLLSAIIMAILLPVTEILAVILYKEKFTAEKGVSLALSLWGFVSYFYGELKHSKEKSETETPKIGMPLPISVSSP